MRCIREDSVAAFFHSISKIVFLTFQKLMNLEWLNVFLFLNIITPMIICVLLL